MAPLADLSPILYLIIAFLGVLAIVQYLLVGDRPAPRTARPPLIAVLVGIVCENLYFGVGRAWPDFYTTLAWWWPGVLFFKLTYISALAVLNLRLSRARAYGA